MKHKKIWNFEYRGIHCEIVHWDFDNLYDFPSKGIWNGYIIITEEQVPDRFKELLVKKKKTNYKSMPWMWEYWGLDNLFKMNGGITYYSVIRDEFDGRKIAVKVGNDYTAKGLVRPCVTVDPVKNTPDDERIGCIPSEIGIEILLTCEASTGELALEYTECYADAFVSMVLSNDTLGGAVQHISVVDIEYYPGGTGTEKRVLLVVELTVKTDRS